MSIDLSEFHDTFYEESFEAIDAMESSLLEIDCAAPDMDEVNSIFRGAHSIKGGSGMFGFTAITEFTHVMETLLDEIRNQQRPLNAHTVDILLGAVDCLREMLQATRAGDEIDTHKVAEFRGRLEDLLADTATPGTGPAANTDTSSEILIGQGQTDANADWRVRFRPDKGLLRMGNDPARLLRELAALGHTEVHCDDSQLPGLESLDPESCYLSWEVLLHGAVERTAIEAVFEWVEDECEIDIEDLARQQKAIATPESEAKHQAAAAPQPSEEVAATPTKQNKEKPHKAQDNSSIRVGTDKVDDLINLVGELVITESMLRHFGSDFDASQIEKLRDGLDQLARNTREIQESVMRIRMLPVKFCFSRFPRMVHDLCARLGKKVELHLTGEQTALDKTVLEKINDPLVHAIRNCLDHGIEMPETRLAAGKPASGNISLNAYHAGGQMVIEVIDDGAGLPRQKILTKARERGIVSETQVLSDEEIDSLIFAPGFSTADQVSDVSGRGVGMDVVRKNIIDLGGTVHIQSSTGKGCTLTIRLPLTLAILDGQLVRVGQEIFVIALASIVESLRLRPKEINTIHAERELYRFREEYIPIIRLYEQLSVLTHTADNQKGLLVIVEVDGQRVGIFVDELLNQQQVVIKSLERNYQQIPGLSGATILGDGHIALILDIPGLVMHHPERKNKVQAA